MTPIQFVLLLSSTFLLFAQESRTSEVSAGVQVQIVKTLPQLILPSISIEKVGPYYHHHHHHHLDHGFYYHHYPLKHVAVSFGPHKREASGFENIDQDQDQNQNQNQGQGEEQEEDQEPDQGNYGEKEIIAPEIPKNGQDLNHALLRQPLKPVKLRLALQKRNAAGFENGNQEQDQGQFGVKKIKVARNPKEEHHHESDCGHKIKQVEHYHGGAYEFMYGTKLDRSGKKHHEEKKVNIERDVKTQRQAKGLTDVPLTETQLTEQHDFGMTFESQKVDQQLMSQFDELTKIN